MEIPTDLDISLSITAVGRPPVIATVEGGVCCRWAWQAAIHSIGSVCYSSIALGTILPEVNNGDLTIVADCVVYVYTISKTQSLGKCTVRRNRLLPLSFLLFPLLYQSGAVAF